MNSLSITQNPAQTISHLEPKLWDTVNRLLIRKSISEFTHELLIVPTFLFQEENWGHYSIVSDALTVTYTFRAKKLKLDHWHIDENSIKKTINENEITLDALHFILEFKTQLGIPEEMLPTYLEEITSTLYGSAYKQTHEKHSAAGLTTASFQEIEHSMTEGHPCFVANNGRIGFNAVDYNFYTPEAAHSFSIVWLAGHKDRTAYNGTKEIQYEDLILQELGKDTIAEFNAVLTKLDLNPDDYFFIPVHPWQWFNKLVTIFTPDIAQRKLVCLGYGSDNFLAQQSIRTLFNSSNPHKFYTKMALSILNMGFVRGLSPYYMDSTPPITEWLTSLFEKDSYLQQCGFTMLGEVATVGYRNLYYEQLGRTKAHNKMLSALWRESPVPMLAKGQKLMTMAAFLHIDKNGNAFLPELIKSSGLTPSVWVQKYLKSYLSPLLHCFYKYEIVFMPHGENIIMILENNIPVKAIMKDITEEVLVFNPDLELPEKAKRLFTPIANEDKILSILTDVFDCFFRFMGSIFEEYSNEFSETDFWEQVAICVIEYQYEHPQLKDKFEQYDLFAPEFKRCCLNRLQLCNNKQMLNLADPIESLQFVGTLKNPIAVYKDEVIVNDL
ncbi:IucA/IucC family siderophore biosynthesis protein [Flavobacterium sp. LS1R49]|uniref:IucA/IucC family siderophore biosynthesis protein n=1 Tax=Flavobacterium shii TaxID=2987687 RepID=A0A9X2YVU4_9FLAO|nr:IucA/IucC family siderophore biosynthesis protein [Flavobacterium shii]MCV9928624.1 IucA/IucC family siderophore biosynthesis protein [Flavobacterium shii]